MVIKFGEIDSAQILDNEFRIGVLEHILDSIIANNKSLILPSKNEYQEIRKKVFQHLQKKYPKSGLNLKEE